MIILLSCITALQIILIGLVFFYRPKQQDYRTQLSDIQQHITAHKQISESLQQQQQQYFHQITKSLHEQHTQLTQHLHSSLTQNTHLLQERFDKLNQVTEQRLDKVSAKVEERLEQGFEKTNATFTDIIKRLALIDDAQKKIADLSSNVVSLQSLLDDKRSRGAFGEIQLHTLIANALPSKSYSMQHTLNNGLRADCVLFLPQPTGNVIVDSKFPLENYQRLMDAAESTPEYTAAKQQFKQDIKKHIQDIASKYIIPGETADGALMFIPAESIFAHIHAHHADLVDLAHQQRVWMASPSTMMAIITTASAVLKDASTREQVHIIQKHLQHLGQDFGRFEKRMDNLSKHIHKVHEDADLIHTSAKKITKRFAAIEQVDLGALESFTDPAIIHHVEEKSHESK